MQYNKFRTDCCGAITNINGIVALGDSKIIQNNPTKELETGLLGLLGKSE
jgi:hypothetical protein